LHLLLLLDCSLLSQLLLPGLLSLQSLGLRLSRSLRLGQPGLFGRSLLSQSIRFGLTRGRLCRRLLLSLLVAASS
jgi:hypothetical protein